MTTLPADLLPPFPDPPADDAPGGREYLGVAWPALGAAVAGAAVDFLAAVAAAAADPESAYRAALCRWKATVLCELFGAVGLFGEKAGMDTGALAGWLRMHPVCGPAIAAAEAVRLDLGYIRATFAGHEPDQSLAGFPTAGRTAMRFVNGYLSARTRGRNAERN